MAHLLLGQGPHHVANWIWRLSYSIYLYYTVLSSFVMLNIRQILFMWYIYFLYWWCFIFNITKLSQYIFILFCDSIFMVMRCKLKQTGYSFICNLYYPFMTGISQNLCNCIYFIAKYSNIFQIIANKHEKFIFYSLSHCRWH
jgi:hypothetical protein